MLKLLRDASCPQPESARPNVIPLRRREAQCAHCPRIKLCLPAALTADEIQTFAQLIDGQRRLKNGDVLYHAGNPFQALYAIRSGSFKTSLLAEDGREQVASYHMQGEIIGHDGIATASHTCTASTLEDSEVCALPFDRLEVLARAIPILQQGVYRMLAREVSRNHDLMLLLGSGDAQDRLASFLLDLSERCRRCGLSASELTLHLSREEIGSYLGLNLATVSRGLSRLQAAGLIQVQGRHIKLLDPPSLKRQVGRDCHPAND